MQRRSPSEDSKHTSTQESTIKGTEAGKEAPLPKTISLQSESTTFPANPSRSPISLDGSDENHSVSGVLSISKYQEPPTPGDPCHYYRSIPWISRNARARALQIIAESHP